MGASLAEQMAELSFADRQNIIKHLTDAQLKELEFDWAFWGRPEQQLPAGDWWTTWLILAGRGFGKTRTGAETVRAWACGSTPLAKGAYSRFALVAETSADARDVMVEGESGLLAVHPKDFRPLYEPSKRRLTWPNGAVATLYNAVEPDQLRGPQHDAAWLDELAKWRYAQETYDQLQFGLRLGSQPRQVVTTTPRPIPLLKMLMSDKHTVVTKGRTDDNRVNLAEPFLRQIVARYEGTRLGRQELNAEILDDIPNALWTRSNIDQYRVNQAPDLERIVVGVDPAVSSGEEADESGIVVAGIAKDKDGNRRAYVLEDLSVQGSPEEWARMAVAAYRKYDADHIIAEKNNGGEMVESVLRTVQASLPVKLVHASRGKYVRAEPISALYVQGRVHHVGCHARLEDQMVAFTPDYDRANGSPDRMDALVWALTELFDEIVAKPIKPSSNQNNPYRRQPGASWMS